MKAAAVVITAKQKAELIPIDPLEKEQLGPAEVCGPTLFTLISPGTELAGSYMGEAFPSAPGYAAVFRAESLGPEVKDLKAGDLLFCMGPHRSFQRMDRAAVLPVPEGLAPEKAVIARLMGVTMTTFTTTSARPGDVVVISGAGPVGYLAAHLFSHAGYEVHVVEPNERRRTYLNDSGISRVYSSFPTGDARLDGKVALVVECSGHEQAALDACRIVRKRGEVVMVGVPWKRRTDLLMHDLLHTVFHRYVVLRSGWEWELPLHASDFSPHSIFGNLSTAMNLLAQDKIPVERFTTLLAPEEIQSAYEQLLAGGFEGLFPALDWSRLE